MKRCGMCQQVKPLEMFYKQHSSPDGHGYRCKDCCKKWAKERYAADPEAAKASVKQWNAANRERLNERRRLIRAANPELARRRKHATNLKSKFSLTTGEYQALLEAQDHRCAVCHRVFNGDRKMPGVDHDHTSGAVRGILCDPCNAALGHLQDDPDRLRSGITYLTNPPAPAVLEKYRATHPQEPPAPRYEICVIDGCDRPVVNVTHGWCGRHYQKWVKYGDPTLGRVSEHGGPKVCTVDGCDREVHAKGLCHRHYLNEWKRRRTPSS